MGMTLAELRRRVRELTPPDHTTAVDVTFWDDPSSPADFKVRIKYRIWNANLKLSVESDNAEAVIQEYKIKMEGGVEDAETALKKVGDPEAKQEIEKIEAALGEEERTC